MGTSAFFNFYLFFGWFSSFLVDLVNGVKQFPIEGRRYIVFLFSADKFSGEVIFSNEGKINLNRLEFVITFGCTGRCKHCSQGKHENFGKNIDAEAAAEVVREVAGNYSINSLMTFGGEPMIYPESVYAIHSAAREMNIPKRQLITNGFFSKNSKRIRSVAERLIQCGVNDICLSVDAFHQETIPLETVKEFAAEIHRLGVKLRAHPAWLVSKENENPYNRRTAEILAEFEAMGISQSDGNIIVPSGNALTYLSEYFDMSKEYVSPYTENPADIRAISINPDGNVLDGNIYETDIQIFLKY